LQDKYPALNLSQSISPRQVTERPIHATAMAKSSG
jgi:hypothetical protein